MRRLVLAALVLGAGCVAPPQEPPPDAPPHGEDPPPAEAGCVGEDVSETRLLRLTPAQYERSVRALLMDDGALPAIPTGPQSAAITELEVAAFNEAAHALIGRGGHLPYAPCDTTASFDADCFRGFVRAFGLNVFRRPVTAEELATLEGVWTRLQSDPDVPAPTFREAIDVAAEVMLQAPQTLYRRVDGVADPEAPEGLRRTTGYERAEVLAFLLTDAAPDGVLLAAAERGELDSPAGLRSWAEWLLERPGARAMARQVASAWLGLDKTDRRASLEEALKDPARFPYDSPELRAAMRDEVESLYEHVLFDGDGRFESLLLSRKAKVNGPLAALYGLSGEGLPDSPTQTAWVELPEGERAGLFTRAAFLAQGAGREHTSPIRRGVHLYREVLGLPVADPPPNVSNVTPAPSAEGELLTTRASADRMTSAPACVGCHAALNPLGYALEGFDAMGARRTVERVTGESGSVDLPIETVATVEAGDVSATVAGATELSSLLAQSEQVRDAHVELWFERAAGEAPSARDACTIDALRSSFREDGDLRKLLLDVATGPRTRWARPQEGATP